MNHIVKIVSRFKIGNPTARQYISLSQSILLNLKKFHSLFRHVNSWGTSPTSWTEIEDDFANFENVVMNHIYDDEIVYTDITGKSVEFSLEAISWAKFSNSYSNLKKPPEEKYLVSIGAGGGDGVGFINIELPSAYFCEFSEIKKITDLIVCIQQSVELEFAYVYTRNFYEVVVDHEKCYEAEIGWLNFFRNKDALKYIPKKLNYTETKDGVFLWLEEYIVEPTDEIVCNAINTRDSLAEFGFLV